MSEAVRRFDIATDRPTPFVQVSLRLFGSIAHGRLRQHPQLGTKLAQARIPVVPVAYLAATYGHVAVAVGMGVLGFLFYLLATGGPAHADPRLAVPLGALPALLGIMTYSYDLLKPDLKIGARRRNIEANLPYGLNFMAALASAGVVPDEVFGALGGQEVYGELAQEASLIHRDTKLFSKDLITALQDAAKRSPSQALDEFLQGAVNTITSGGDLKTYLLAKSEQFSQENRRKQKGFLESLGVMAESYVVVAAAAPLFLIVILSVMLALSDSANPVLFLNLIILVALPVIHGSFTYLLRTMRPD